MFQSRFEPFQFVQVDIDAVDGKTCPIIYNVSGFVSMILANCRDDCYAMAGGEMTMRWDTNLLPLLRRNRHHLRRL